MNNEQCISTTSHLKEKKKRQNISDMNSSILLGDAF